MTAFPSEATVLVSKFQQITSLDLTESSTIGQATTDNVVAAFLASGKGYTGLGVTANGDAKGVTVGKGILYNLGGGYPLRSAFPIDLTDEINAIPDTTSSMIVLVVASGGTSQAQETRTLEDASLQPTNPADLWPTTQELITTRVVRSATPDIVAGVSAVSPQVPAYNPLLCLLATVTINKTGVIAVAQNTDAQITRLDQLAAIIDSLSDQVADYSSILDGLLSSVAGLQAAEEARDAAQDAEIVALRNDLTALRNLIAGLSAGATTVYTVNDYYTDETGLTVGTGYGVGSGGLAFPSATSNAGVAFFPVNKFGANVEMLAGDTKMTVPFSEELTLYQDGQPTSPLLAFNAFSPWTANLQKAGFGVSRTRYGALFTPEATAQLLANGDPSRLFAIQPSDLQYDPSWADWRQAGPELTHSNGFWKDLTSRGFWTPRSAIGPIAGIAAIDQVYVATSADMLTTFAVLMKRGTFGDMRLLICGDLNGAADPSNVLADVTVAYADLGGKSIPDLTMFQMPYPVYQKPGIYHYVLLTTGDHQVRTVGAANGRGNHFGPVQALANGAWIPYGSGNVSLAARRYTATFNVNSSFYTPIALNPLYLGAGIDTLDLLTPAIVPDGCSIDYLVQIGSAAPKRLAPFDTANPNQLAGRPSTVPLSVSLGATSKLAPIIDLGVSAAGTVKTSTGKQSATLTAESAVRTPPAPVTKVSETLIMTGYDPAFHTISIALEAGPGFTTPTPANTVGTPVANSDGSTSITWSWVLGAAVPSFKTKITAATSDSTHQFKVRQSVTAAGT